MPVKTAQQMDRVGHVAARMAASSLEKRGEMRPIIEKQLDTILGQDVEILREQTRRIRELGGESYRSTPLDLMGPEILRMLRAAEQGLPTDTAPIDRRLVLRVF